MVVGIRFGREEREDLKLPCLLCWPMYFPGKLALLELGAGIKG